MHDPSLRASRPLQPRLGRAEDPCSGSPGADGWAMHRIAHHPHTLLRFKPSADTPAPPPFGAFGRHHPCLKRSASYGRARVRSPRRPRWVRVERYRSKAKKWPHGGWGKRAHTCISRAISEPPRGRTVVGESEHQIMCVCESLATSRRDCRQARRRACWRSTLDSLEIPFSMKMFFLSSILGREM